MRGKKKVGGQGKEAGYMRGSTWELEDQRVSGEVLHFLLQAFGAITVGKTDVGFFGDVLLDPFPGIGIVRVCIDKPDFFASAADGYNSLQGFLHFRQQPRLDHNADINENGSGQENEADETAADDRIIEHKSGQNHKIAAQEKNHQGAMQHQIEGDVPPLRFGDKMQCAYRFFEPYDAYQHDQSTCKYQAAV